MTKILIKGGYKPTHSSEVFSRFQSEEASLFDIDFMFVDNHTLMEMINAGKEISIDGYTFPVPSLDHLLALKLHSIKHNPEAREYKDLLDILNLTKKNKVKIQSKKFRTLCLKYRSEKIYQKIISLE